MVDINYGHVLTEMWRHNDTILVEMNYGGGEALESNRVMSLCTHNTFNNMSKAHTFTHYERHELGKYDQV